MANPLAAILSAAMMLRYTFDLGKEADSIENAVNSVLSKGYGTADIALEGEKHVGTAEMGQMVKDEIQ